MTYFITYNDQDYWYRLKVLDTIEGFHRCIDSWCDFPESSTVEVQAGIESNGKLTLITLQTFQNLNIAKFHHDYRKIRKVISALVNYTIYKSNTSLEASNTADIFDEYDKSSDNAGEGTAPWWELATKPESK